MPYRADVEAQRQRCEALERELGELRLRAASLRRAAHEVAEKEREVAAARALLAGLGGKRSLGLLDSVRVASPCSASWDDMVGDDRARFCGHCARDVYDLSALSREEAQALLLGKRGDVCARLYVRTDGTVLTADCPVGVKKKRVRRAAAGVLGGGLMAAGLLHAAPEPTCGAPVSVTVVPAGRVTMGEIAVEDVAPPASTAIAPPAPPPLPKPQIAAPHPIQALMGRVALRSAPAKK